MTCSIPINVDKLDIGKKEIEYKYVVYSSKISVGFTNDEYEYVYNAEKSDKIYNRCLIIDRGSVQKGRILKIYLDCDEFSLCLGFVQYDAIAWPSSNLLNSNSQSQPAPGLGTRLLNAVYSLAGRRTASPSNPHILADGIHDKMFRLNEDSKLSLCIHLEGHKRILCECLFDDSFRIESFSDDVNHIFHSLQNQNVKSQSLQVLKCSSLLQVRCYHNFRYFNFSLYLCPIVSITA